MAEGVRSVHSVPPLVVAGRIVLPRRMGATAMDGRRRSEEHDDTTWSHTDQLIDEAGEESFPASDPPATWSGTDRRDPAPAG